MLILSYSSIHIVPFLLTTYSCVTTESLQPFFTEADLIALAPPGFIHLELLKNVNYLSAVAEDTYFRQVEVAARIRDNMIGVGAFASETRESTLSTSKLLADYMYQYYGDFFEAGSRLVTIEQTGLGDSITKMKEYVDGIFTDNREVARREELISYNPPGTHVTCPPRTDPVLVLDWD